MVSFDAESNAEFSTITFKLNASNTANRDGKNFSEETEAVSISGQTSYFSSVNQSETSTNVQANPTTKNSNLVLALLTLRSYFFKK